MTCLEGVCLRRYFAALLVVTVMAVACVSPPPARAVPERIWYTMEATEALTAQGVSVSAAPKYNPLDPSQASFSAERVVCHVWLSVPRSEPFKGTLVAIAVSLDGNELGRAREKVVIDNEGHPIRFRFDPPVDLSRISRYRVDLEPY